MRYHFDVLIENLHRVTAREKETNKKYFEFQSHTFELNVITRTQDDGGNHESKKSVDQI